MISKSKKEKIFTERRADFAPNFSEDQKKTDVFAELKHGFIQN